MAYNGYLLKIKGTGQIDDYVIDAKKYIQAQSYSATRNVQDLDAYRDEQGVLHRNALTNAPIKIEFTTPPMMTDIDMEALMGEIRRRYTNIYERKLTVSAYSPEVCGYVEEEVYLADIQFPMYGNYGDRIKYNPIRFAFIGY